MALRFFTRVNIPNLDEKNESYALLSNITKDELIELELKMEKMQEELAIETDKDKRNEISKKIINVNYEIVSDHFAGGKVYDADLKDYREMTKEDIKDIPFALIGLLVGGATGKNLKA